MDGSQPLLPQIIDLHGRWIADKRALTAPDATLTWKELCGDANRVANGLIDAGCGKGARIGVVMNNSAAMATAMLGAIKAGAAVVPLNTSISDEAVNALLADAGVSAICASVDQTHRLSAQILERCRLRLVETEDANPSSGWSGLKQWRAAQSPATPQITFARDDICNIIYSSGTTGRPKGIVHTHGVRIDWTHDLAHALRYDGAARTLITTGLYSNISWVGMLCTLMLGGALVVRGGFDAADALETIEHERITHASMVPVQYQRMLEHPDFARRDTSSMRAMMSCGSALPARVKAQLFQHFACGVIELYGTTEGVVTTLAPEDAEGRLASVGKPLPGEDLRILGDGDAVLGADMAGEIVASSRFAMAGYWNNEQATADAFWNDESGRKWLRTGDIGRIDSDGFLYITDRKKDMIISGGQNIYPADLEAVLMRHEEVSDCAVIGIPNERWGETPLALVVFSPNATIDDVALLDWANAQLGKQQRISAIERRDTLPRNANGKLLKRELRAPYWPDRDRSGASTMQAGYTDHEWRSRDGLKLHARDYGETSAKLPVICIPGLTRNARDFEEVAPWIAARGRRVLAVDLRGRGGSDRASDPRTYHPRVYADDMSALLASIGARKAIFVGTSLGGLVTLTLAARNPKIIGGAVINDVGPRIAKAGLARIQSYVGKRSPVETWADAASYAKHTNGVAYPDYPDEAWLPFARRLFKDDNGKPTLDYDPLVFRAPNPLLAWLAQPLLWAAFRRLAKAGPLLLVHGELTDVIDQRTIERMQRAAPQMQVAAVPRVGHAPMLTEPAARDALAFFLERSA